jgi:phosphatidylserine/phosphatidylglycerophosphate/cardiolipin synthase-like enzyme
MASWRYVCLAAAFPAALGGCTSRQAFFSASDDIESVVTTELAAASTQVDVAIYTFTSENIQNALLDAQDRGVAVRVIMDSSQAYTLSDQTAVLERLRDGGVDARTGDGFGGGILHDKFIVVDLATVLTGSYNYTRSANDANDENLVVLADPNLARAYDDAFQEIWDRGQE